MKIRFKKTSRRLRFDSLGLRLTDGDTAEVSKELADHLFRHFADNFERIALRLDQLGPPLHEPLDLAEITIVATYYDPQVLEKSLLSYLPEETELIKLDNSNGEWPSIAQALNHGINRASNDIIICSHQDTRFDPTWFGDFIQQECRLDKWGILGITGFDLDRRVHWGSDYDTPRKIAFLDECCIILDRRNGLLFDEKTFKSWHRYGIDFCLQCHEAGLGVYLVTGLAYHDCYPDVHPRDWWEQHKIDHQLLKGKWGKKFPELLPAVIN